MTSRQNKYRLSNYVAIKDPSRCHYKTLQVELVKYIQGLRDMRKAKSIRMINNQQQ